MRQLFLKISLLLLFSSAYSQQAKTTTKTTIHFDIKGMNDTLVEFYNERNQLYKVENSYAVSHNYFLDTILYRQVSVSRKPLFKGCYDTAIFLYRYNNGLLAETVIQTNICPGIASRYDRHTNDGDTIYRQMITVDSLIYKYDRHGRLLEEHAFQSNQNKPYGTRRILYDASGRPLEDKVYVGDSLRRVNTHEYGDSIKITNSFYYPFEHKSMSPDHTKVMETYNRNGQLIRKLEVKQINGYERLTDYIYRSDGKLDSEVTYGGDKFLLMVIKYEYN